jgi:predicted permease
MYVCMYVCVFMQSCIFICFLLISVILLPSFAIYQPRDQALHLRKEFLKAPPLLVGVIHTTSNRKDIWSPVDVAVRQLCFHTGCCTYVLIVPHHVH